MDDRVIYTKEEIEAKVKIPAIVEVELKHLVEDKLKQSGLYYRIFSRVKTASSMARKFQRKNYNQSKKIQDLIGIRIDVYFEDDLRICKNILERTFSLVEWSESEKNAIEFKSVKINGVFRLPQYLRSQISSETWDMCIDDTIEIQLKTVFFEGWHEIEHDMKYKGGDLWSGRDSFSRYFNSILATLELCDKSLVTLFENLGHDLYKDGNWAGMMKAHYRLKMDDRSMYPELEEILNNDHSPDNIGKIIFKTSRQVVVDELLKQPRRVPINVNTIAALVNKAVIHDEKLDLLFHEKDVFDDGSDTIQGDESALSAKPEPLRKVTVFKSLVNLSTYKYTTKEACIQAAKLTYSWIYEKFGRLDIEIPEEPVTCELHSLGFRIHMTYEPWKQYWKVQTDQIDMETPGQVWVMEAECYLIEDGRQMLSVRYSYATAVERKGYLNRYFSCPKFYSNICDKIGVFDVRYLSTSRKIIRNHEIDRVRELITSYKRTMPVCLVISETQEGGWLNEGWLENFRVYDFTRMAGRYTHIYTCSLETGREILGPLGIDVDGPSLYVFKSFFRLPERDILNHYIVYRPEDVQNCIYGRSHLQNDGRKYDIVKGGQAFYHKLLQDMRSEMMDR